MPQAITPGPGRADTVKVIEDKTRALAANQGLNESAMWDKIDIEMIEARAANRINETELFITGVTSNKRGRK
ncbi:hypothetical protein H0W80_01100 [Candidatus Saccharibacteria bacterium]|nr:hypothetical protein [Candidatus Saccharibacteria bacterium]